MIRCLVVGIVFSASVVIAADQPTRLHQYFDKTCQSKKFMGAASVSWNGKAVFSDACGWADAEWEIGNAVDTRFRTGSIAKQFTAAAVLLLEEEGKLLLSDPVGKYLTDLPESWRSATIHELLTHTSGIPIYTSGPAFERLQKTGATPTETIDLLRDKPLLFPHGTKFQYNNTGYIVLGMLIEKASGMAYDRFVQSRLFDRLEMRDTGFDDVTKIVPRRARGYSLAGSGLRNADYVDARTAWSAGGFYSTVHDLTTWSEALAHGKLLNSDSTQRMFGIYPETVYEKMHYGYAVVLAERFGHQLQYHGGGITGFQTVLQRYPELGLVIVVMANLDSGSETSDEVIAPWSVADGLARIWFGEESH